MFQHQSLGIKVSIRVTKLVLLRNRPVSSNSFLPFCCNGATVFSQAEQDPCAAWVGNVGCLCLGSQNVTGACLPCYAG